MERLIKSINFELDDNDKQTDKLLMLKMKGYVTIDSIKLRHNQEIVWVHLGLKL